uniref:Ig-like domain-containing protein n=1 Tax=Callorhinchus milii TaxID=7868 RepID=A0A4W3J0N9_CALMI
MWQYLMYILIILLPGKCFHTCLTISSHICIKCLGYLDRVVIHWYRHQPGKELQWMLYYNTQSQKEYAEEFQQKFSARKKDDTCLLSITNIAKADAATYYCASWDYHSHSEPHKPHTKTSSDTIYLCLVSAESLAQTLIQPELSITRDLMKTARMHCQVEGIAFESAVIHWYRQTPKQSIRRIMYIQSKSSPQRDDGFSNRFTAENIAEGGISRLEIAQLETSDAGTYYCACWVSTVTLSNSKRLDSACCGRNIMCAMKLATVEFPFQCNTPFNQLGGVKCRTNHDISKLSQNLITLHFLLHIRNGSVIGFSNRHVRKVITQGIVSVISDYYYQSLPQGNTMRLLYSYGKGHCSE